MKAKSKIVLAVLALALVFTDAQAMRWYSPSTGKWLSRDPAEEQGGLNLYAHSQNDTIDYVDPLGLWKWKGGQRDGNTRAKVIAEKCADPYADLATLVHLDPSEVKKWLETWKPNEQVRKDDEFTVPNTVYVNWHLSPWNPFNWWFIYDAHAEADIVSVQGYHVVPSSSIRSDTEKTQFSSHDIFGLIHVAHGDPDKHGYLQEDDVYMLSPSVITLHHKVGGLKVIECWGDELPWKTLVSPNGFYWAGHGEVHSYQLPSEGF